MKDPLCNTCCSNYPDCNCLGLAAKVAQKMAEIDLQEDCEHEEIEDGIWLVCDSEIEDDGSEAANRAHEISEGMER